MSVAHAVYALGCGVQLWMRSKAAVRSLGGGAAMGAHRPQCMGSLLASCGASPPLAEAVSSFIAPLPLHSSSKLRGAITALA